VSQFCSNSESRHRQHSRRLWIFYWQSKVQLPGCYDRVFVSSSSPLSFGWPIDRRIFCWNVRFK
jgi:hypothetical protein